MTKTESAGLLVVNAIAVETATIKANVLLVGGIPNGINLDVLSGLRLLGQSRKRENHQDQNNGIRDILNMGIALIRFVIFYHGMGNHKGLGTAGLSEFQNRKTSFILLKSIKKY